MNAYLMGYMGKESYSKDGTLWDALMLKLEEGGFGDGDQGEDTPWWTSPGLAAGGALASGTMAGVGYKGLKDIDRLKALGNKAESEVWAASSIKGLSPMERSEHMMDTYNRTMSDVSQARILGVPSYRFGQAGSILGDIGKRVGRNPNPLKLPSHIKHVFRAVKENPHNMAHHMGAFGIKGPDGLKALRGHQIEQIMYAMGLKSKAGPERYAKFSAPTTLPLYARLSNLGVDNEESYALSSKLKGALPVWAEGKPHYASLYNSKIQKLKGWGNIKGILSKLKRVKR